MLTLGAYIPVWFGLTWSELRDETADERMYPLGHALSTLVPGWNAWQTWQHFRAIDALAARTGSAVRVDATSAAIGLVIWWLTFTHYSLEPLFLALDAVELAAGSAVVVYGQRALNAAWERRGGEERVLQSDVVLVALAASYFVISVLGLLSPAP